MYGYTCGYVDDFRDPIEPVESCRRNPKFLHFADATKNRSDDVKQWEYKRKRDLDALMSYHQVKGLVNWQNAGVSHGQ